ncbi:bifunctional lysylphosphatidylglycerol flippase/synthetase MprF [Lentilactobacillus senioris]|uniref:bifunctional lysylphosphatidylglycerol flippase/synthetase MprF n=1 Tax=Lentilactobacillus senioris TaxID=931534 RepID=UPI002281FC64|nr:bifunctional lysylphosphatidylglycerol flippase/synthetase MprF [Lentilactobacillus senioris]MCY9806589.1 bifunctional lysylphosphatidylglycerol flippase/synthetase MprF [Lentilactobacillus senioris]
MLKSIVNWIRSNFKLLKTVFLVTVVVIVFSELLSIAKSISLAELKVTLKAIPLYKLLITAVIGIISVLPMTGYDFILNNMLHTKYKKRYVFETSWFVNTVNNIAGFGGLISIGLRSEFYAKDNEPKEVMSALSKILLFLEAGLSLLSLVSLVIVVTGNTVPFLQQYWIWLVGGSIYFPAVYVFTKFKKSGLLGGLTTKNRLGLTLTSFLEWSGVVIAFMCVGWAMGVSVSILEILPLFIAASVIGIVSLIPGALGSFDVIMILGLSSLGVPRATSVIWLILFRLAYYVIPLVIGGAFFFDNTWQSINAQYSGIPKNLALEFFHKVEVFLLYFSGIMIILLATIPQGFTKIPWLKMLNIYHYHIVSEFPNIILGFSLLVMGRGIAARVKRAYWPTIALLIIAILYTFFFDFSMIALFVLGIMLIMIVVSRTELYREQLVYSWQWKTADGFIIGILVMLYTIIGVYNRVGRHHHHKGTISFFLFPSEKLWVFGFVAIFIVSIFMMLFFRYLEGSKHKIGVPLDEDRVLKILNQYGGNVDSQLAFLGDKVIYFYNDGEEDTVFFQFVTYNNKCIVMGDPAGKKEDFQDAIQEFLDVADRWCYQPIFYETNETSVITLHEMGYDFIKMGEQALVDLNTFTTAGKKMKGTRSTINKITKAGYQFDVLQPPFDEDLMATLQDISDYWLKGRKEKGFSMGFFSESYLQRAPIAVVKDPDGQIVSFANFMPTYTKSVGTIDLMRHGKDAPSGSMDFLFVNLFDYMKERGVQYFDLGMAPLSNVGLSKRSFMQERVAHLVYEFGARFYSFQGIRDYKEKYSPKWISRYTLYPRKAWIVYVMIVIMLVDNRTINKKSKLLGLNKKVDPKLDVGDNDAAKE